jgi:hypothetical protein
MEEQYLSLFDYLNKPAGPDLGKAVAEHSKRLKVKPKFKEVSNPKYTGKVLMYPKSFLDGYFKPQPTYVADDLPF